MKKSTMILSILFSLSTIASVAQADYYWTVRSNGLETLTDHQTQLLSSLGQQSLISQ